MLLLVAGFALIGLYVVHARRAPYPILDLGLLAIPTFRASILGGFMFRLGIGSLPFLLPLLLQIGFGMNPFQSGCLTFASAAGAMADEDHRHADPAPIRLQAGAGRECRREQPVHGGLRNLHGRHRARG